MKNKKIIMLIGVIILLFFFSFGHKEAGLCEPCATSSDCGDGMECRNKYTGIDCLFSPKGCYNLAENVCASSSDEAISCGVNEEECDEWLYTCSISNDPSGKSIYLSKCGSYEGLQTVCDDGEVCIDNYAIYTIQQSYSTVKNELCYSADCSDPSGSDGQYVCIEGYVYQCIDGEWEGRYICGHTEESGECEYGDNIAKSLSSASDMCELKVDECSDYTDCNKYEDCIDGKCKNVCDILQYDSCNIIDGPMCGKEGNDNNYKYSCQNDFIITVYSSVRDEYTYLCWINGALTNPSYVDCSPSSCNPINGLCESGFVRCVEGKMGCCKDSSCITYDSSGDVYKCINNDMVLLDQCQSDEICKEQYMNASCEKSSIFYCIERSNWLDCTFSSIKIHEFCYSTLNECKSNLPKCGDGKCEPDKNENKDNCQQDCKSVPQQPTGPSPSKPYTTCTSDMDCKESEICNEDGICESRCLGFIQEWKDGKCQTNPIIMWIGIFLGVMLVLKMITGMNKK